MFHRISHSSSESPIESEIEMEPPADQLRRMAFDRRNKNWLEESWNLIDTIEKNNKGRQSVIIKQETLQEVRSKRVEICFWYDVITGSGVRENGTILEF